MKDKHVYLIDSASDIKLLVLTWICEAWRSMVMMWSAPATDNMFATSLADMGARLWDKHEDTVA